MAYANLFTTFTPWRVYGSPYTLWRLIIGLMFHAYAPRSHAYAQYTIFG